MAAHAARSAAGAAEPRRRGAAAGALCDAARERSGIHGGVDGRLPAAEPRVEHRGGDIRHTGGPTALKLVSIARKLAHTKRTNAVNSTECKEQHE